MAVNLLGNPNDFARIHTIIGNKNITLIEDNCESLGATYEGKQAGTFGVMGSYSSFFSHHISTKASTSLRYGMRLKNPFRHYLHLSANANPLN